MKTELDEEHFQHLIYAINRVLLLLRAGGLSKQALIGSGKTLLRMTRITKAYVRKKAKQNLSAKEFAEKLLDLFNDMHGVFTRM